MAELPRPGELWADFDDGRPDVVSVDSVDDDGTIWLWVMGRDYAGSYCLDRFLRHYRPATVVPTPTADDWIDPAVRLPEVGDAVWLYKWGESPVVARDFDYRQWHYWNEALDGRGAGATDWRWAPILVGPPLISDASEVE